MKNFVIYVPGLADKLHYQFGQRTALAFWKNRTTLPYYFVANWFNQEETFNAKLKRLLLTIDDAHNKGYRVTLMAASAGSSLMLTAFYERRSVVLTAVSICGKLHRPETVPEALLVANPAFKDSMTAFANIEPKLTSSDRSRILVVRAARDSYVPAADGAVKGSRVHTLKSMGHVFSIMYALTFGKKAIMRFIER